MLLSLLFLTRAFADVLTRQLLALPCEEAFEHYKVSFSRSYPTDAAQAEAQGHFCAAHAALRTANFSQADFRFHNDTDKPLPYRPPLDTEDLNKELAQSMRPSDRLYGDTRDGVPHPICHWRKDDGPSPLGNMTVPLPRSFDLREQGLVGYIGNQASCGNCWAFGSNAVMSAAVARGTPQYRANENFSQYFGNGIVKSYLSVGFLSIRTKRYCVGSTFTTAIYTLETGQMPTVELNSNFPFTFGGGNPPHDYPEPKIPESAWLVPFQFMWREDAKCYRAGVGLGWNPKNPEQAAEGIYRLKSHLARGVATITYVNTKTSPNTGHILGSYHSGYLDIPCVNPSINHVIAFVGYGTINGTEVWILRNSWGGWWGISGYVYFKIGSNSICCEQNPRTIIPKYMEFNETTIYESSNYTDFTVAKTFVRGNNGLEMDCDAGFYPGIAECLSCTRHTPHCGMCTKTECMQCAEGYHFTDGDSPTCVGCAARNCVECNPSYCCSCVEGFHLVNGVCIGDA